MRYKLLDRVVLKHDIPKFELCAGDLGTIVDVYKPNSMEVEFIKASGETLALVTLTRNEIRSAGPADIVSVRSLCRAA